MFMPMSSWLESVMIALAFCCLTTCRAPARAMSGALPELASATSRRTVLPDCLSAWLTWVTANRIDSAQLGVAIDPVRSISWPRTITDPFAEEGASAAGLHAAAQIIRARKIRFIIFSESRGVGIRRGRQYDLRMIAAGRRRFDPASSIGPPRRKLATRNAVAGEVCTLARSLPVPRVRASLSLCAPPRLPSRCAHLGAGGLPRRARRGISSAARGGAWAGGGHPQSADREPRGDRRARRPHLPRARHRYGRHLQRCRPRRSARAQLRRGDPGRPAAF